MRTMYDAIDVLSLPDGADLYAGYDDGNWPDADAIAARFPGKPVVRITVFASDNEGDCLDIETGNATPADGPGWVLRRRQAGKDPSCYCNFDTWPAAKQAFATAAVPEPHWWVAAAPGIGPSLYPGSVAHQYGQGDGYDISVVADYWPGIDPAPVNRIGGTYVDYHYIDAAVMISNGGGNLVKDQVPGWDGSCPINVVPFGNDGAPFVLTGWEWSADGRIDFRGTNGGPWGVRFWLTGPAPTAQP